MKMKLYAAAFAAAFTAACASVPPKPPTGTGSATVTSIQPDLVCSVPQEEFDIVSVVSARLGAEAGARLTRLLATDFKSADLTPKDREVLKYVARETLWIPSIVESWLGDGLMSATKSDLVPIHPDLTNVQTFANKTLRDLVTVSPKTPFEIELMVLESGTPSGMIGGRIFIDLATVREAMSEQAPAARKDKLVFIYAHELAHIYKRHQAKRLQERLVSIDEAHKVVRTLLNSRSAFSDIKALVQTVGNIDAIVAGLRSHQAEFLRSQEVEADACAAALMVEYGRGDPVRGFETYAKERGLSKKEWTIYNDHPPDAERKIVIEYVATSNKSRKPIVRDDVRSNLLRHIKKAARRDA